MQKNLTIILIILLYSCGGDESTNPSVASKFHSNDDSNIDSLFAKGDPVEEYNIKSKESLKKDLEAVIPHNVHVILVPKVEDAKQLKEVDDKIQSICKKCARKEPVYLMPILESASGILNSLEIAKASKNNVAIAIGLEDYTADIGVQRTKKGRESLFARSQIINAARSAGIQAIDTVFSDINA